MESGGLWFLAPNLEKFMRHKDNGEFMVAAALHAKLSGETPNRKPIELPEYEWWQCQELVRRIGKAYARCWHAAAAILQSDLAKEVRYLTNSLAGFERTLTVSSNQPSIQSAGDICRDLLALSKEFNVVAWSLKEQTLSVTTPDIVLQGIGLGPFEIRLSWAPDQEGLEYKVIAKDPNPSSPDDTVTHPHVRDEELCEGEGRGPIERALSEGRVYDFFLLVLNILQTYNGGSPHVSLAHWHGNRCSGCGDSISEGDGYSCSSCESEVCDSCLTCCRSCDRSLCSECSSSCTRCRQTCCAGCLEACIDCDDNVCGCCRADDDRCLGCHESLQTEERTDDEISKEPDNEETQAEKPLSVSRPATSVHAHRVGQARVSARSWPDRGGRVRHFPRERAPLCRGRPVSPANLLAYQRGVRRRVGRRFLR